MGGWGFGAEEAFKESAHSCDGGGDNSKYFDENEMSSVSIISRGSPPLSDVDEWARVVSEEPVAVRFKLKSITSLLRDNKKWFPGIEADQISDIEKDLSSAVDNICETLLGEQCEELAPECGLTGHCAFDEECKILNNEVKCVKGTCLQLKSLNIICRVGQNFDRAVLTM